MNVGIQSFGTHFGDLFRLAAGHVVEETTQVDACVKRAQLFLVQVQHLVHAPLVLQLHNIINIVVILLQLALGIRRKKTETGQSIEGTVSKRKTLDAFLND